MTTRRGFLTGILALGAAPTIVRAESLMRLWVPPQDVLTLDALRRARERLLTPHDQPFVFVDYGRYDDMTVICKEWATGDGRILIRSDHHG